MKEAFQFHNGRLNLSIYKAWKGIVKFGNNGEGGNFHRFLWKHSPETQGYGSGFLRLFFFSERIFFSRRRFSFDALEGLLFFLILGFTSPCLMISRKRRVTSSLFLCWLRDSSLCRMSSLFLVRRDCSLSVKSFFSSSERA